MLLKEISVSPQFRKKAVNAVLAIVLFIIVYCIFLALAVALTVFCAKAGINIIVNAPSPITIIGGVGIIALGVFVLFFLVKFLFAQNTTDRTHLTEITREEHPRLFAFVEDIAREAGAPFPKKIYLAADVNACVFYDSGFWSMFFPVKKNLQIGLGLVNTVSENEFRAILAHEFGHFSQRSMKVGSYAYNVNRVIYNMLFENNSYQKMIQSWSEMSGIFSILTWIAVKMVQGIQWVLRRVYALVNTSYMGLSREMEFHADEVAANVAGSTPITSSLRRAGVADYAYNVVLNYYSEKIAASVKTTNIYPLQSFVLQQVAENNKVPVEHGLPMVDETHLTRYNKSKLVIKDQWASHPAVEDRVAAVQQLNMPVPNPNTRPAFELFENAIALQEAITGKLFSLVEYAQTPETEHIDEFKKELLKRFSEAAFHPLFNNYYDNRNPVQIEPGSVPESLPEGVSSAAGLYSNEATGEVYTSLSLENDIQVLKQIQEAPGQIKTFDYDGKKYTPKNCAQLVPALEKQLEQLKQHLAEKDRVIYQYFNALAQQQGKQEAFRQQLNGFFETDKDYDRFFEAHAQISNSVAFMSQTLPFETIEQHIRELRKPESDFKQHIRELMAHPVYSKEINEEATTQFNSFLQGNRVYFNRPEYFNNEIEVLYATINQYQAVLSAGFIQTKREMLQFLAALEEGRTPH
ncbi:MAG: M48 family metallopeptidase [Dinghuibacter sp.]|nr:M48 family metallopeptidase [Dinghuibacter sp.]